MQRFTAIARPKDSKGVILRLKDYLLLSKKRLFLTFLLVILSNLLALIGPSLSGLAIDNMVGFEEVNLNMVWICSILMVIFYSVSSILSYIVSLQMIKITQATVFKMRTDVFHKLMELPISYFDKNQTGDIISKVGYDIDTVNTSLANDLIMITTSFITIIGSFIMMLIISKLLILVFVVTIPLSFIMTRILSKLSRKKYRVRSKKNGELNGFVEEMISGIKTIKAFQNEENVLLDFSKINDEAINAAYEAEAMACINGPSINFVNNLSLSLISVFGALLYMWQKISLGDISAFVLYSRKFSGPINEMANIASEIQSALAAAERVFHLLDNEIEKDPVNAFELEQVLGKIEFNNVSFSYIEGKRIIKNLSFVAEPGKVIAIVGPTGAGKTTLVNLLMRFYDIDSGSILLDGVEYSSYTNSSIRQKFSMVLQDTWLFNGTIYENVSYGSKDKTLDDVIHVCKNAYIHNFIMSLKKGYDTVIGEDNNVLSKGQKQLVTIARAMLSESKMLILDEATSNVDTMTELKIQDAMNKLTKGKTSFIIAHRLSTIQNADLILVVKNGNIVEQGTHHSLLESRGFYHEIYQSQYK